MQTVLLVWKIVPQLDKAGGYGNVVQPLQRLILDHLNAEWKRYWVSVVLFNTYVNPLALSPKSIPIC